MSDQRTRDLELVLAVRERSLKFYRDGMILVGLVGLVVAVASVVRGIFWLGAFGVAFFGGLGWLGYHVRQRALRSPVVAALREQPELVVRVRYNTASSSGGAFRTEWLIVHTPDAHVPLRVDGQVQSVAAALKRLCPKAHFDVPGFER